jgi:hypothetical protein
MQKVLVILTAYNCEKYLDRCLAPWLRLREAYPGSIDISAVSVPFAEFPASEQDRTQTMLRERLFVGEIDWLSCEQVQNGWTEWDARTLALRSAKKDDQGQPAYDLIFLLDGDEVYRDDLFSISSLFALVESMPEIASFHLPLTNLVFTPVTALAEPFYVRRIWRVKYSWLSASRFANDNSIDYIGCKSGRKAAEDRNLPTYFVPPHTVAVDHYTWLNDATSQKKISYQKARWGECPYCWDSETGLRIDGNFYAKRGQKLPDIILTSDVKRAGAK